LGEATANVSEIPEKKKLFYLGNGPFFLISNWEFLFFNRGGGTFVIGSSYVSAPTDLWTCP
jgi:hypothetical protein